MEFNFQLKLLTEELRRVLTYVGPEERRPREDFVVSFVLPKDATTKIETLPQVLPSPQLSLHFETFTSSWNLLDPVVGCYWLSHVLWASS